MGSLSLTTISSPWTLLSLSLLSRSGFFLPLTMDKKYITALKMSDFEIETFMRVENLVIISEIPIAESMHAIGASVNIRRTITPAKYHARVPYKMINMPPSVTFENKKNKPTGAKGTRMCKSKKKEVHEVGWCSLTDAMMGINFEA